MQRQKTITLRKGDPTAQVRMEACSQDKEKRKQEQAKKKQQRDELLKKKAEEKARKAEEKKKLDEQKSKQRTLQTQKHSNSNIKPNPPKGVRINEVEHSESDTILKPNESKRARQREVHAGEHSGGGAIDVNMCFDMYEDVREGTGR